MKYPSRRSLIPYETIKMISPGVVIAVSSPVHVMFNEIGKWTLEWCSHSITIGKTFRDGQSTVLLRVFRWRLIEQVAIWWSKYFSLKLDQRVFQTHDLIYVTNSALSNDRIILPKSQVSHHSLAQESFSMPRPLTNTPRDTVLSLQEAKSLYQMIVNTIHYHISQINEIRIFGEL